MRGGERRAVGAAGGAPAGTPGAAGTARMLERL